MSHFAQLSSRKFYQIPYSNTLFTNVLLPTAFELQNLLNALLRIGFKLQSLTNVLPHIGLILNILANDPLCITLKL